MSFWRDIRNGATLTDPASPEPLMRPCLGPNGWIVGRSGSTGKVWKYDGTWRVMTEQCVSQWAGAIDYSGLAVWVELGVGVVRENPAGGYTPLPQYPYQSGGIQDIQPDNTVIMVAGPNSAYLFTRTDGSQYLIPAACVRGDYVAGYANAAPIGIVCGQISTGVLYRVWTGDPQSLPIRLDDDGQTVSVSGASGGFIPRSAWTVEPALPILPDIKPFTSKEIVAPYPTAQHENTTHSAGMNSRLLLDAELVTEPGHELIREWFDLEQGAHIPDGEGVVYCDIASVPTVAPKLKPWHVLAFNCYPNPGESANDFLNRIRAVLITTERDVILVAAAWNRGTLTDQEVLNGMVAVRILIDWFGCLGVALFGLDRGTNLTPPQFKPIYQQCADLFVSPLGRPSFPTKPIPPEPPMRMFKDDAERTNYCNVAAGHRVTVDIPIAGGNEFANPGDKFTRSGQQVNQALDKWNTVQVPNSVPSVTVILDVVRDALKGLPDSEMAPSLAYEVPLRQ